MSGDQTGGEDLLGTVSSRIRDVGSLARHARRYRALVAVVAEPVFDRVLALGSEVRRAARGEYPHGALTAAVRELAQLEARCNTALAEVTASHEYLEALTCFDAENVEGVAMRAPAIFTSVLRHEPDGDLYWPVPLTGDRSGPHFIPPEHCAARIRAVVADGLVASETPVDLGGDASITPVVLNDEHDGSESPIALIFEPKLLPGPVCRLADSSAVLFYGKRMRATPRITCRAGVDDEWWRIRPDSYRRYLADLQRALQIQGPQMTLSIVG